MSIIPDIKELENNNLILTTPAGIICGKLISEEEVQDGTSIQSAFAKLCVSVKEDYFKETSSEKTDVSDNDGYIFLKDVKIKSTSTNMVTNVPFMIVFYDQIIGVSIGSIDW